MVKLHSDKSMVTAKTVLLVTSLLILMGVSNEKKMKCILKVTVFYPSLSECYTSKEVHPILKMKNMFFKLYNKESRVIFKHWWFGGIEGRAWAYLDVDYDPETVGFGMHFDGYHDDDQSMNDNPVRSGYLYRQHSKIANKAYGQGTDLSELYYRRAGVMLPTIYFNCSGTTYPLWEYEPHHCKIAELVVGNHGLYEIIGNPPSAVPVYYAQNGEGDFYYF